jgi:Zn-dependent M32 family carboxypeptidase
MLDLKLIDELKRRQAERLEEHKPMYDDLVRRVADGNGGTAEDAEVILASVGKSVAEFVADVDTAKDWDVAVARMLEQAEAHAEAHGKLPNHDENDGENT